MAGIDLYDYQLDAVNHLENGSILCGGVGSGKSRTALAYYYLCNGGKVGTKAHCRMKKPKDLYIITTARKRDTLEWEGELSIFLLSTHSEVNGYSNSVVVDSWNNIKKYKDITNGFFIFDEQRVIGNGVWVKSFLKIAKHNSWILLSATPGDTWMDYVPVFIANGFYRNRTAFTKEHVVYSRFTKFPQVDHYVNTGKLLKYRKQILVNMDFIRDTCAHHEDIHVNYDVKSYKEITKKRWDPYKDAPIVNAANLCYVWRKVVNSDESRQHAVLEICDKHPRIIIFYNFDYELEILKNLRYPKGTKIAEWNGHEHEPIPKSKQWVYLIQYTAGCEGWNCISTDTIIFYSQNYSYKTMVQAAGRIDRLNTPYHDLYYFHLKSRAPIDLGISRALKGKKNFNERQYARNLHGA